MTIHEIAQKAGVSISTVSKVLNKKDDNISDQTRQKVMQIIEEENFVPYAKIRDRFSMQNKLLGLIMPDILSPFAASLLMELEALCRSQDYVLLTTFTGASPQDEKKAVSAYQRQQVDSVIYLPPAKLQAEALQVEDTSSLCMVVSGERAIQPFGHKVVIDKAEGIRLCLQYLVDCGYRKIGFLLPEPEGFEQLQQCFLEQLYLLASNMEEAGVFYLCQQPSEQLFAQCEMGLEALLCYDMAGAMAAYQTANDRQLLVPHDLAVICMEESPMAQSMSPPLTTLAYPMQAIAQSAFYQAIGENGFKGEQVFNGSIQIRQSVGRSKRHITGRIVVVGWINMDISTRIAHRPQINKPVSANQLMITPGGKGCNQAIIASHLGALVSMVGVVGDDLYGKRIYAKMRKHDVITEGVSFNGAIPTGTAYINVLPDGSSLIVGHAGANIALDKAYISQKEALFEGAGYCLSQNEMEDEALMYLANICHAHQVKLLLKPNAEKPLPDDLLKDVYMLVPSEKELNMLVPGKGTVAQKARELVNKGVTHVIVTLGSQGCMWVCQKSTQAFAASEAQCVDATGASDAFIAALAVMLNEGSSIPVSLEAANQAAGFSIRWEGSQNTLPERWMLGASPVTI